MIAITLPATKIPRPSQLLPMHSSLPSSSTVFEPIQCTSPTPDKDSLLFFTRLLFLIRLGMASPMQANGI